jgi:hypothetical protein
VELDSDGRVSAKAQVILAQKRITIERVSRDVMDLVPSEANVRTDHAGNRPLIGAVCCLLLFSVGGWYYLVGGFEKRTDLTVQKTQAGSARTMQQVEQ